MSDQAHPSMGELLYEYTPMVTRVVEYGASFEAIASRQSLSTSDVPGSRRGPGPLLVSPESWRPGWDRAHARFGRRRGLLQGRASAFSLRPA